ncbi:MAG: phosphoribosylformylglycinamidine cyclo-ligase, partial [Flavobacteriales bacterium]|nr:phosphoribosylformylglycinamidine cyclo-ligase [Flavobacteriales bacterium]
PTRTYAPVMMKIFEEMRAEINGMIHCSGGGQTKILHFLQNGRVVKDSLFETPKLFSLIQEHSKTAWKEMYQVFNMGHRLELYLPEERAQEVMDISTSFGVDAKIIGRVEESTSPELVISQNGNDLHYSKNA